MQQESTTVRVSRRTHQILAELAVQKGTSVAELLDRLTENARRSEILDQYNTRMTELLADPPERADWSQETARSEVSAVESIDEHAAAAR